ncbi:hypothetical protein AB6C98_01325 [Vibrio splendidus]
MSIFLFLYGFFLPFTNAFALTPTITFNVLLIAILPFILIVGNYKVGIKATILVFVFIIFQTITTFINGNEILVGHVLSVFVTVFGMFYFLYISISGNDKLFLLNGLYLGYVICCLLTVTDFILANYFSVHEFLPRPIVKFYDPTFIPSLYRARGPIEESGHTALYLGLFLPIIYYYLPKKSDGKFILLASISFLLTFSISGFVFFPISCFIVSLIMTMKKGNLKPAISLLAIIIITMINHEFLLSLVLEKLNSISFIQRYDYFMQSYDIFINSSGYHQLFGLGGGYYKSYNVEPPIGLYLTALFSFGIIGLMSLLALVVYSVYYSFFILKGLPSVCYSISLIYGWLFYGGVSNYWYPWIWIVLAMMFSKGFRNDINHNSVL